MFRQKLETLLQQCSRLQQLSREHPEQNRELLQSALTGLQQSLNELQSNIAEHSEHPASSSNPAGSNGTLSNSAWPPELTVHVADATARKDAEREVKRYQARLRTMMADLLLAEEHERRRLAVDLHDGLSQTIALAQMKLSALRLATDGQLANLLDEIEELIEQANRAARSISFELSPPVLHDLGLEPAVQWLVENIQTRYGIEILMEDDGQPKPAGEKTRVIIFRAIRELLINAAKHAQARRVHVRLQREGNDLHAAIEDDGVGMRLDVAAVKGSGLFSIHERLRHVGGSMSIESEPGRGTKIRLRAPLTNTSLTKVRAEA